MRYTKEEEDEVNKVKEIEAFMRQFYHSQEPVSISHREFARVYTLGNHEAVFHEEQHSSTCDFEYWTTYLDIMYADYIANEQFYRELIALHHFALNRPTVADLAKINSGIHENCLTTPDIMKQVLKVRPELKEILVRAELLNNFGTNTSEEQARLILERDNAWNNHLWFITDKMRRKVLYKHLGKTYMDAHKDHWYAESPKYQNKDYVIGLAEAVRKASEEIRTGLDDESLITKLANKCKEYLHRRQQKYLKDQSLFKQKHQNSDRSEQNGQLIEIVTFRQ